MKTLFTLFFLLVGSAAMAQGQKFSAYPNSSTLQAGDLFLFSRAGTGTFNIDAVNQLPNALGLGSAAFTSSSAYDAANTAAGVSAILSNHLNAANITQGIVPPANLGSGTSISGKFLRGDSTYQTIGGGGDMLSANNLSDVANAATALANLSGVPTARTLTVNGTANQITSSAGAQDLSANRTVTLSLPNPITTPGAMNVTGGFSNQTLTASTLLEADANKKLASIPNGFGALTNDANGNFGYVPMLDASTLGANGHVKTGANTNLISSEDFTGLTNSVLHTNYGTATNLTFYIDGNNHTGTITNGSDVWLTPSVVGAVSGSWSWEVTTNCAIHWNCSARWLAGSNGISTGVFSITNGEFDATFYGATNFPHVKTAIGENQ